MISFQNINILLKINFKEIVLKKIIMMLVLTTVMIGCSSSINNSEKNIAIVEKYIKSVEDLDSEGMDKFLAEDYMGYGPSHDNEINKVDAIKNWKEFSTNLYKSIKYTKNKNIAVSIPDGESKGEWVTNWAELNIVYKRDNAEVTLWANTLYQIENDKIIKSYTIYNEADALHQLGYIFINNNEK